MGVSSVDPKSAERTTGHSGKAVLWLGASEAPLALVTHLRSRGIALVTGSGEEAPVPRLMLVEAAVSPAARSASVKGRRVAVIHPDPGSADALAQALRGRGAQVVALSLNPESLDRVEALDPDAVLMEVTDFYGACWEIVRALWQHPRLKYAPVLLATPEGVASYAQGTPDVPSLCLAVQAVSEAYERAERAAAKEDAFEIELAQLGPAKILRVLTEANRGFRASFKCPLADFEVDVAEGIIVGAQGSAKGTANDLYLGVHALALLLTQERGRVQVRVAHHPAATNVMAPLDAALHSAREAKAAPPKDAAATREVAARVTDAAAAREAAARVTVPSPSPQVSAGDRPTKPIAIAAIVQAEARARRQKEAGFEPARPSKAGEARRSAREQDPEASGSACEQNLEEPKAPVGAKPVETGESAREPEASAPEPQIEASHEEPGPASLAQPKKTLLGLPPPRRTTSTGRIMAVVPRDAGEPAESVGTRATGPASRAPQQSAVAQARALLQAQSESGTVQDGAASARSAQSPALKFDSATHELPVEESRVTATRGVHAPTPAAAIEESSRERRIADLLAGGPARLDRDLGAAPEGKASRLRIRLERWQLKAGLVGIGLVALTSVAAMTFWPSEPQGNTQAPPTLPVVAATPPTATPVGTPAEAKAATTIAAPEHAGEGRAMAPEQDEKPEQDPEEDDDDGALTGDPNAKPPSRQASALVSQGHNFRKHRQYTNARARYQEALTLLPGYPRALAGLAQLAIAQNKGKDAIAFAQKLVHARPGQAPYQLLLGDAYKAANMPKEAQQAWQAAVRAGSSAAKARLKTAVSAAAASTKTSAAASTKASAAVPAKSATPAAATKPAVAAKPAAPAKGTAAPSSVR